MKVKFDTFLLKIFNDIIGIYPAGSVVLLNSDEIAVVLTNNEKDKANPYIQIVGNKEDLYETPQWVDLSSASESDKNIVRLIDPEQFGLKVQDFILKN